jgi:hypothetical protein
MQAYFEQVRRGSDAEPHSCGLPGGLLGQPF